jgi:hypothetical protein
MTGMVGEGHEMTIEELRDEKRQLEQNITDMIQPLLEQFSEKTKISINDVEIGVRESDFSTSIGSRRFYFTRVWLELGI